MFRKILIANRGEIAVRVIRSAHRMGIYCVAVYSDIDAHALHARMADEAYRIGPAPSSASYLNGVAIIEAALQSGAEAIHPGYGFLSENADFAEAVQAAGLVFIGPPTEAMRAMGLKDGAKRLMTEAGVPVVPGFSGAEMDAGSLARHADELRYPVLIKARAGGGGKGMRRVEQPSEFQAALASAQREAASSFGDPAVIIEKYISRPRHIEVQVFADSHGNFVHLFERDCSLQRRHQKVIEEAPAPGMKPELRGVIGEAAVKAARAVNYRGAGTVEFIADVSDGLRADRFYFMEMNTRLQVEHPVTEEITGLDLVEWQLRVAADEPLPVLQDDLHIDGHAFEARIYAEDPARDFAPATGRLDRFNAFTTRARVDTGVGEGDEITPFYDPMIAKVIVHAENRTAALTKLATALDDIEIAGCTTNLRFLRALARHPDLATGNVDTGLIERSMQDLVKSGTPGAEMIAAGMLAALKLTEPVTATDPWDTLRAFRIWGEAEQTCTLLSDRAAITARVRSRDGNRHRVLIDGVGEVSVVARPIPGSLLRLTFGNRETSARIVYGENKLTVMMDGDQCVFELPNALTAIADKPEGGNRIVAPFPGIVKLVFGSAGTSVEKGEPLIVMEAMKLDHTFTAHRDGVVAEVLAKPGNQVQEGTVLLTMEAVDA